MRNSPPHPIDLNSIRSSYSQKPNSYLQLPTEKKIRGTHSDFNSELPDILDEELERLMHHDELISSLSRRPNGARHQEMQPGLPETPGAENKNLTVDMKSKLKGSNRGDSSLNSIWDHHGQLNEGQVDDNLVSSFRSRSTVPCVGNEDKHQERNRVIDHTLSIQDCISLSSPAPHMESGSKHMYKLNYEKSDPRFENINRMYDNVASETMKSNMNSFDRSTLYPQRQDYHKNHPYSNTNRTNNHNSANAIYDDHRTDPTHRRQRRSRQEADSSNLDSYCSNEKMANPQSQYQSVNRRLNDLSRHPRIIEQGQQFHPFPDISNHRKISPVRSQLPHMSCMSQQRQSKQHEFMSSNKCKNDQSLYHSISPMYGMNIDQRKSTPPSYSYNLDNNIDQTGSFCCCQHSKENDHTRQSVPTPLVHYNQMNNHDQIIHTSTIDPKSFTQLGYEKGNKGFEQQEKLASMDPVLHKACRLYETQLEIYFGFIGIQTMFLFASFTFSNFAGGVLGLFGLVSAIYSHLDRRCASYMLTAAISSLSVLIWSISVTVGIHGFGPYKEDPTLRAITIGNIPLTILFIIHTVTLALQHSAQSRDVVPSS